MRGRERWWKVLQHNARLTCCLCLNGHYLMELFSITSGVCSHIVSNNKPCFPIVSVRSPAFVFSIYLFSFIYIFIYGRFPLVLWFFPVFRFWCQSESKTTMLPHCLGWLSHIYFVHLFIFLNLYFHIRLLSMVLWFLLVYRLRCLLAHKITVLPHCLGSFTCIYFFIFFIYWFLFMYIFIYGRFPMVPWILSVYWLWCPSAHEISAFFVTRKVPNINISQSVSVSEWWEWALNMR